MTAVSNGVVSELIRELGQLADEVDHIEQRAYDPHLVASLRKAEQQASQAVSRAKFDVSGDPVEVEATVAAARAAIGRAKGLAAGLLAELERSRRIERRAVELSDEALRIARQSRRTGSNSPGGRGRLG
jgi:hypothetical protein